MVKSASRFDRNLSVQRQRYEWWKSHVMWNDDPFKWFFYSVVVVWRRVYTVAKKRISPLVRRSDRSTTNCCSAVNERSREKRCFRALVLRKLNHDESVWNDGAENGERNWCVCSSAASYSTEREPWNEKIHCGTGDDIAADRTCSDRIERTIVLIAVGVRICGLRDRVPTKRKRRCVVYVLRSLSLVNACVLTRCRGCLLASQDHSAFCC